MCKIDERVQKWINRARNVQIDHLESELEEKLPEVNFIAWSAQPTRRAHRSRLAYFKVSQGKRFTYGGLFFGMVDYIVGTSCGISYT